jgi:hypothetical protein
VNAHKGRARDNGGAQIAALFGRCGFTGGMRKRRVIMEAAPNPGKKPIEFATERPEQGHASLLRGHQNR